MGNPVNYLIFVCINDTFSERVEAFQIEPIEIGRVSEQVIMPIRAGLVATVKRGTGYTMAGTIEGKSASFTLCDEDVPIAQICVCLDSSATQSLWNAMYAAATCELPDLIGPPSVPWVAIRYEVAEPGLPEWLDQTAKAIGWTLATE